MTDLAYDLTIIVFSKLTVFGSRVEQAAVLVFSEDSQYHVFELVFIPVLSNVKSEVLQARSMNSLCNSSYLDDGNVF